MSEKKNENDTTTKAAKEVGGAVGQGAGTAAGAYFGGAKGAELGGQLGKMGGEQAAGKASKAMKSDPKPNDKKAKEKEEKSSKGGWVEDLTAVQKKADENAKGLGLDKLLTGAFTKVKNYIMGSGTSTQQLTSFSPQSLDSLPKSSKKPSGGSMPGADLDITPKPKL